MQQKGFVLLFPAVSGWWNPWQAAYRSLGQQQYNLKGLHPVKKLNDNATWCGKFRVIHGLLYMNLKH